MIHRHEMPRVVRCRWRTYKVVGIEGLEHEYAVRCSWLTYFRLKFRGAREIEVGRR